MVPTLMLHTGNLGLAENTLAYFAVASMMKKKSFKELT
jgi:hypothetical protein